MKPGDIIQLLQVDGENIREAGILSRWGSKKDWFGDHIGKFFSYEYAIVLEIYKYDEHENKGIPGCKIITSSGLVGWFWSELAMVIK